MLVLDSSALFSLDQLPEEDSVCPPGVVKELTKYKDPRLALWGDLLHVSECTKVSVAKVEEAARKTGDIGRLSPVDITVLALALDVHGTVLTDDYSIQNTARVLGIPYRAVGQAGITRKEKWNWQCTGCGKWFKEKYDECPICGSPLRSHRKRRSREQMLTADELGHPPGAEDIHAPAGAGVAAEREGVGELLVVRRDVQRLVEHIPPGLLVVRQRTTVLHMVRRDLSGDTAGDHRQRYTAAVHRKDLPGGIADDQPVAGHRLFDGA
ncbi:MAG: hypothetical protein WCS40_05120, partial [Methanomethylophilus sp.]